MGSSSFFVDEKIFRTAWELKKGGYTVYTVRCHARKPETLSMLVVLDRLEYIRTVIARA